MNRKFLKVTTLFFIVFGLCLQSCGTPSKTLVASKKENIPPPGKLGIISVYVPVGPPSGVLDLAFGNEYIDKTRKVLQEATPAPEILEEFTTKLTSLFGITPIIISEYEPEVLSIKVKRGIDHGGLAQKLAKLDNYAFEKLDYSSLRKRFGIDNLIVLQTCDLTFIRYNGSLELSLVTTAKLINLNNNESLWYKKIDTTQGNVGGQGIGTYPVMVDSVKKVTHPQIVFIVDELIKDLKR